MARPLENHVALVTGARHAIGRALTVAFVEAGASVLALDRDLDGMNETVRLAAAVGPADRVDVIQLDLADAASAPRAVEACVARFGGLHCLVNNAADQRSSPLDQLATDEWDETQAVNLRAPVMLARAALPHLSATRGSIVSISSVQARAPWPRHASYAAAKAGLLGVTYALAGELGPLGIRVNAICPGHITVEGEQVTPWTAAELTAYPLGRFGQPEEIASVAVFLASDAASFITGQAITVDGGMSAVSPSFAPTQVRPVPTPSLPRRALRRAKRLAQRDRTSR